MAASLHSALVVLACPPKQIPWPGEPCQPLKQAMSASERYLRDNIFSFDKPNEATYFNENGIVEPTVKLSLQARMNFSWAANVPRDIFNVGVLPYASVNEARSDWRQLLWSALTPQPWVHALPDDASLATVALAVNAHLWTVLGNMTGKSTITFKAGSTPLVYDPLSTILFGHASCTGVSITFVDALRTLGVPARLVGTPAWHGKPADGNHNWVEVWLGAKEGWRFIEGAPAGSGESFDNPCDKWFCNPAHFNHSGTEVYAATYTTVGATYYPMCWDEDNHGVAGVDRTAYYDRVCSAC